MRHRLQQIHLAPLIDGYTVVTVVALLAGVALIASGRATTVEATGYMAPFLLIQEQRAAVQQRSTATTGASRPQSHTEAQEPPNV